MHMCFRLCARFCFVAHRFFCQSFPLPTRQLLLSFFNVHLSSIAQHYNTFPLIVQGIGNDFEEDSRPFGQTDSDREREALVKRMERSKSTKFTDASRFRCVRDMITEYIYGVGRGDHMMVQHSFISPTALSLVLCPLIRKYFSHNHDCVDFLSSF